MIEPIAPVTGRAGQVEFAGKATCFKSVVGDRIVVVARQSIMPVTRSIP